MGALRRILRTAPVAVGAAVAVGGLAACEPGGIGTATVSYTTDQTATRELDRQQTQVRWLTCTASRDGDGDGDGEGDGDKSDSDGGSGTGARATAPAGAEKTLVTVDCEGKTDDDKDITVHGKVTRVVNGACVRGDLTAEVGGKQVFHVDGLGNCDTAGTPPADRPSPQRPGPTVTVTRTIWCPDDPHCRPVEGK
ncbi:hypothetical protein [Streptomyces mayonensis]|uniref:hypothetical protein n=1 Tax=Streptomyces mayonensis TaxID=2750816 RepID=UPI001C1E2E23|nr:hypothetical protein [Streptomyces sp. A108]MBU6530567.1 hypothetical protein [Streptomyces sp. A108]